MELELEKINNLMTEEISSIRDKYNKLKRDVRKKYKELEKKEQKNKRKTIPKALKDKIWDDTFGSKCGEGKCYVCSDVINSKKFECGHIVAVAKGGNNDIENLKPICSTCNKSMGVKNMEEFKKEYFSSLNKKPIQNNKPIQNTESVNIRSIINKKCQLLNQISNLIKELEIKKNIRFTEISNYIKTNDHLDNYLNNIPGIINPVYLKRCPLSQLTSKLSNCSYLGMTNQLSSQYGIPCIDNRIKLIQTLIDNIEPYKEIQEEVNNLLNSILFAT